MIEAEILFPVKCPACAREALTGFRLSVVLEALQTGQIRLYSTCHLSAWDANPKELDQMCEYLDVARSTVTEDSVEEKSLAYIHTGMHDRINREQVR